MTESDWFFFSCFSSSPWQGERAESAATSHHVVDNSHGGPWGNASLKNGLYFQEVSGTFCILISVTCYHCRGHSHGLIGLQKSKDPRNGFNVLPLLHLKKLWP